MMLRYPFSIVFAFVWLSSTAVGAFQQVRLVHRTRSLPTISQHVTHIPDRKVTLLKATKAEDDEYFDVKTTVALVGSQALLIAAAAAAAAFLHTPNLGLGANINFGGAALLDGVLKTLPLGIFAYLLDFVEESVPALKAVTMATQRSVMALLGTTWKPVIAVVASAALGLAAGVGEEMLFRGVMQYELAVRLGDWAAVGLTSLIFGALHAVTPAYAFLATLASFYFGWLYQSTGNLAVPMAAHALYDMGALIFAHYTITRMTKTEQQEVMDWEPAGMGGGGNNDEVV